jgi:hypothetical protein
MRKAIMSSNAGHANFLKEFFPLVFSTKLDHMSSTAPPALADLAKAIKSGKIPLGHNHLATVLFFFRVDARGQQVSFGKFKL